MLHRKVSIPICRLFFCTLLQLPAAPEVVINLSFAVTDLSFFAGTLSYFAGTLSFSLEIDLSFFRGQIFGFFSTKVLPSLPSLPSERPLTCSSVSAKEKQHVSVGNVAKNHYDYLCSRK